MSLPTQILPDHHHHCDDLFVAAENAVQRGDWTAAASAFAHFHDQMNACCGRANIDHLCRLNFDQGLLLT